MRAQRKRKRERDPRNVTLAQFTLETGPEGSGPSKGRTSRCVVRQPSTRLVGWHPKGKGDFTAKNARSVHRNRSRSASCKSACGRKDPTLAMLDKIAVAGFALDREGK